MIDSEIGSINRLVEEQASSTSSLLNSLDDVHKTGEFTIRNAPLIDKAVDIYQISNEICFNNLNMMGELLSKSGDNYEALSDKAPGRVLKIGYDIAYPPWTSIQDGKAAGISVEHTVELFKGSGREIEFDGGQWAELYDKLLKGDLDCILNVGWPNEAFKDEPVTASAPYDKFKIRIFSKEHVLVDSSEFRGKRIAVQKGSFAGDIVQAIGCEPVVFDNDIQGMVQHLWDNVDGIATEERVGNYISESLFLGDIKPVSDILASLDVVYLMRSGSDELKTLFP
jgi:ABC-type amino acid transport substrate-binding protein